MNVRELLALKFWLLYFIVRARDVSFFSFAGLACGDDMIKQEAYQTYFAGHPDQERIAELFDEGFNITFGKGFGDLAFWLAEPKEHVRQRFGLTKEVLVIYSPHGNTDARVLTAIETISRIPEFRHRIDRVLVLLVHSGDKEKTEQLLRDQTEWIVAPIHSSEILSPTRGTLFLRTRIAECCGQIDLFGFSSPIKSDKHFFGRDDLVQNIVTRGIAKQESTGLFGLRKTGKTSVLYAVQRKLNDRKVLVEYIDCQNPGVHAARWWQVLENMMTRLTNSWSTTSGKTFRASERYTEVSAGMAFSSDLKRLIVEGAIEHIILMLDEIEYITPTICGALGQHWDRDFIPFWQTIRAAQQESMGKFTFVVAGVNAASVEMTHIGEAPNPIFQLAQPVYLEPLSVVSVRSMVRSIGRYSGLSFDEDSYQYLQDIYGGHPFLIRIACSEMWRKANSLDAERLADVGIKNFVAARLEIRARLTQPIKDILLSLVWWYPEEYDLLRIVAAGDRAFADQYLADRETYSIQFSRYGLLKQAGGGFAIADLRDFLNDHGEKYKEELSPFKRGDLPPELLPEVPDLVRLGKLFEKRRDAEIRLRKLIAMYLGVRYNWDNPKMAAAMSKALQKRTDRKDPADLFVGRTPQQVLNELFTLELKSIIEGNWDVFASLFDGNKARFEMNLDTINKARRVDAHTKPVSDLEMSEFENSYNWLLGRIAKVPGIE